MYRFAQYGVAKDMQAAIFGLFERLLHDLLGKTLDLDVHLQRCNAIFRPRNLKIHIT